MYKQKWLHVSDFLQYDWAVVEKAATTEIIRRDWMREKMFHTVYAQQIISGRIISGNLLAVCSVLPHTHTQCQRVLGGKWGKMSQWVSRSTLNLGGISCFNWLWRKNLIKWITFFFKQDFLCIISCISNSAFILDYIQWSYTTAARCATSVSTIWQIMAVEQHENREWVRAYPC